MNSPKPSSDRSKDQSLIDQIKHNYRGPKLSAREAQAFDNALMARVEKRRSGGSLRLAVIMAVITAVVVLGMRVERFTSSKPSAEKIVRTQEDLRDLEWVATLLGVESTTEEFEDLPDEYAAMMMFIDVDSDEWNDY
jgi:hypothetical protein